MHIMMSFKVNTFTIDGHSNYKVSLNPSYEFADMIPENKYVKVKSLKFVPSYSYAVKYDKREKFLVKSKIEFILQYLVLMLNLHYQWMCN